MSESLIWSSWRVRRKDFPQNTGGDCRRPPENLERTPPFAAALPRCCGRSRSTSAIFHSLAKENVTQARIASAVLACGLELLLCEDNPAEAAKVLQDCLDRAKKRGLKNVCIFTAITWKATALRIVAERSPAGAARQHALRAAKKGCHAALKITKSYLACRPHALRETGIVAALEGNEEQSRRSFAESLQVAEQYDARYDLAQTQLAQAEAGIKFGWPGSLEQAVEARTVIKELENVEGT